MLHFDAVVPLASHLSLPVMREKPLFTSPQERSCNCKLDRSPSKLQETEFCFIKNKINSQCVSTRAHLHIKNSSPGEDQPSSQIYFECET